MTAAELLAIGTVVGLNNFAVALMLGALGQRRRRWRVAGVFAVFEFTVPLIGLFLGSALAQALSDVGQYVGGASRGPGGVGGALGIAPRVRRPG